MRRDQLTYLIRILYGGSLATLAALVVAPAAASAAAGVPDDPVEVFTEDFENVADPLAAELLDAYTGPAPLGMTYTAHEDWIDGETCNGIIGSSNGDEGETRCDAGIYDTFIGPSALALGNEFGGGRDNHAMADMTFRDPSYATKVATFQTVKLIPLATTNRFMAFSVDVATVCNETVQPLLRFSLLDGATEVPVSVDPINPCTDPRGEAFVTEAGLNGRVGRYATDGSVLFGASALGIKLTNDQGGGDGNDYAIDNIRVLDATPQLDKEFTSETATVGRPTELAFTITNTRELAAKRGWSFTDELPPGLRVATPSNATTDCTNGAVTAGGGTIEVSGDLDTGQTHCTVTLDVVAKRRGTYENGPENITDAVGLDLPGTDTLRARSPRLRVRKRAGQKTARPGEVISYRITVRNKSKAAARRVRVCDKAPRDLRILRAPGAKKQTARRACWTLKRLKPKKKRSFRVVAQVKLNADTGKLRNRAIAKAKKVKRQRDDARVNVKPPTDTCPTRAEATARC